MQRYARTTIELLMIQHILLFDYDVIYNSIHKGRQLNLIEKRLLQYLHHTYPLHL